jgi:hypothetical protein
MAVGADPAVRPGELSLVYEGDERFAPLPTFGVIPAQACLAQLFGGAGGLSFEVPMLLHGEQYLEILRPLPTAATLLSQPRIVAVLDKGKHAIIVLNGKLCPPLVEVLLRRIKN